MMAAVFDESLQPGSREISLEQHKRQNVPKLASGDVFEKASNASRSFLMVIVTVM